MKKDTVVSIDEPTTTKDALTEMLREGAQKLLAEAVQAELEELLEEYQGQRDGQGRKRLVRNGYLPMREIQTGIGGIPVRILRDAVEHCIAEFAKIDPLSETFRYPISRKGQPFDISHESIDLLQLRDTVQAIKNYFMGSDGLLSNLQDAQPDDDPAFL